MSVAGPHSPGRAEAGRAKAPLVEIFHSVQGEGRFAGEPMAFVRVAVCPIRCHYCDTPHSYVAEPEFPVRLPGQDLREKNPVTSSRVAGLVALLMDRAPLAAGGAGPVSVTGGEPLLYPAFVAELGAALRPDGYRLHLETAALDPEAMAACAAEVDHLSADYKLPETIREGDFAEQHLLCAQIALERDATVDVKIVLTESVTDESFTRALDVLSPIREEILLVLQPVTPFGAVTEAVATDGVMRRARQAAGAGFHLRVLPQLHPVLGVP